LALLLVIHSGGRTNCMVLVNIPIGIAAFIGTWKFVPENQPATSTGIDLKGVALLSIVLPVRHQQLALRRAAQPL
jgi:hypothetical protein